MNAESEGGLRSAQETLREAILRQHPEWIAPDGECGACPTYEQELADLSAGRGPQHPETELS